MKKGSFLPRILAVLFSAALIGAFFLPLIRSTKEYSDYLELFGNEKAFDSSDITISEMKELSMFDYTMINFKVGNEIYGRKEAAVLYTALMGVIGIFGALSLAWSLWNKPILLALNSLLTGAAFYLILWDFNGRGIMPDDRHVWGISYYLIYPLAGILFACSIWMLILKLKESKGNSRAKRKGSGRGGRRKARRNYSDRKRIKV